MTRCLVLFCLLWLAPLEALSQSPVSARSAAAQLRDARAALERAASDRDQVRAYSGAVLAYEQALVAARQGVNDLVAAEQAAAQEVAAARERAHGLVLGLMRVQGTPGALRSRHPGGAEAAFRTRALVAALQGQAATVLQADMQALNEWTTLRVLQQAARDDMDAGLEAARAARSALLAAVDERRVPTDASVRAQLSSLAAAASSLAGLADALARRPVAGEAGPLGALEPSGLRWPVRGRMATPFDRENADGLARPGIVIGAGARALVTAPSPARVAFAGDFLGDEKVVILRIGETALLALSGLSVTLVEPGQGVAAGDPIGFMAGDHVANEDFLIEQTASFSAFPEEPLYIELRIDGIATDPTPYFDGDIGQER